MQLDAKRNFLSFFSGYLHLPITAPRIHLDIDDFYGPHKAEHDPHGPLRPLAPPVEPDDLAVGRSPLPPELPPDPWEPLDLAASIRPITPFAARLPSLPIKKALPDPVTYSHGGGGGEAPIVGKTVVFRQPHITVDYKDGGHGLDLRLNQVNMLRDNDVGSTGHTNDLQDNDVVTDQGAESVAWPDHEIMPIADLAQMAAAHGSGAPVGATATPESVAAELRARAEASDGDGPTTLHEGIWMDGAMVPADAPMPTGPGHLVPARPGNDGVHVEVVEAGDSTTVTYIPGKDDDGVAVVETGGNNAANYAAVIDEQGAIGTMLVMGNSYHSNSIFQTNIIVDDAAVAGTADEATLQASGNQANNVAEFIKTLDQTNPYQMGYFGGLKWHVDRVNGDYYDVNLIKQLNVMQDNDKVQVTASDHYKFWSTGGNDQDNAAIMEHAGKQYDLVIVTGDYFGANWIFQTNILLNSDYVLINGNGGEGSETVSTGANWLLNSATLVDYSGATQELTPDMQALIAALQNGDSTMALDQGFVLPGDGSGEMNVLFITGNYYDINVLEQTNIVSDSDVVLETLENGEAGYVATGANELANNALLVDMGPLGGQYVGGTEYAEATLVQTNIIAQSADLPPSQSSVVLGDPAKLTPEAAALITHGPAPAPPPPEESTAPPPADSGTHTTADPLSSVLS